MWAFGLPDVHFFIIPALSGARGVYKIVKFVLVLN